MYEVVVPKSVAKQIRHLPTQVRGRVLEKVAALATDPRPAACRKLVAEEDLYRLRVGDYRIVYLVDDSTRRWSSAGWLTGERCIGDWSAGKPAIVEALP